ncbi:MAG TPA: hypothetical protein PL033_00310 [Candidatus Brocadiia bacterium]|nr:hypothetical protein [Candidatus Brocadiia bacterium]
MVDENVRKEFEQLLKNARIIATAMALSCIAPAIIMFALQSVGFEPQGKNIVAGGVPEYVIPLALYVASFTAIAASYIVKKLLLSRPPEQVSAAQAKDRMMGSNLPTEIRGLWMRYWMALFIALSLAEAGSMMGLVLFILTGNIAPGIPLVAISFAATLSHFPTMQSLRQAFGIVEKV